MIKLRPALALLAATCLLGGCGQPAPEAESLAVQSQAPTAAPTATPALPDKQSLRIGVVYAGDPTQTGSESAAHAEGIARMQKELGLSGLQLTTRSGVDPNDAAAVQGALESCVDGGCDLIFATDWVFLDMCSMVARENPGVWFCQADGIGGNGHNLSSYAAAQYQGWYLAGVAVSASTETKRIGVVVPPALSAPVCSDVDAFGIGVNSVRGDVEVYLQPAEQTATAEQAAAETLLDAGCDIVVQRGETTAPLTSATEREARAVAADLDGADWPEGVLCSVQRNWDVYYTQAVRSYLASGRVEDYTGGLEDGLVELALAPALQETGTAAAVEQERERVENGWSPFDGETLDNEGTLHTVRDIWEINWLFENVKIWPEE